jgi:hypothetical protein
MTAPEHMARPRDIACSVYEERPGIAGAPLGSEHRPRRPERTLLYQLVAEHWPAWLTARRAADPDGDGVPPFIEKEFDSYVRCGILSYGFARVRCATCQTDSLVGLSCKSRGLCPSCTARRMHDTAAQLVDRVLPHLPMRQWVFTFPYSIRWALFFDARRVTEVLGLCLRALFAWQRRTARACGIALGAPTRSQSARSGAVTFIQRVGSDVRPNLHFHVIAADGVFARPAGDPDARPRFHRLPPPEDDDVQAVLGVVVTRVLAWARRRGATATCSDEPTTFQRSLAALAPASRVAPPPASSPLCAFQDGFSLHARVAIDARDRAGLERLCAYGARPALAAERLSLTDDGRVRYRMKRAFADGTRELVWTTDELLSRLCALVPPPGFKIIRHHGAFAPRARGRAALVGVRQDAARSAPASSASDGRSGDTDRASAAPAAHPDGDVPLPTGSPPDTVGPELGAPPPSADRPPRLDWPDLLRRTHGIELLRCPDCSGPRRVVAFLTHPFVVRRILLHLGLPADPPTLGRPRAPPAPWLPGVDPRPPRPAVDPPSRFS